MERGKLKYGGEYPSQAHVLLHYLYNDFSEIQAVKLSNKFSKFVIVSDFKFLGGVRSD